MYESAHSHGIDPSMWTWQGARVSAVGAFMGAMCLLSQAITRTL